MRGETLLVTGASGFTGAYVVAAAKKAGLRCVALCRDSESLCDGVDNCLVAPLRDRERLAAAIGEVAPNFVIHLAAVSFVAHGSTKELYETNIIGTVNLLDAIASLSSPPKRILLASSANVYGEAQSLPITELAPASPVNHYAVSKLSMERAAAVFKHLPITIVRPFNYTGIGQASWFVVPKLVEAFRERVPQISLGDVSVERDFSDVRDVARGYLSLLDAPPDTYNICSGAMYSVSHVLSQLAQLSGHKIEIARDPTLIRSSEIKRSCGSPEKLRRMTGFMPEYELSDTLAWMLAA